MNTVRMLVCAVKMPGLCLPWGFELIVQLLFKSRGMSRARMVQAHQCLSSMPGTQGGSCVRYLQCLGLIFMACTRHSLFKVELQGICEHQQANLCVHMSSSSMQALIQGEQLHRLEQVFQEVGRCSAQPGDPNALSLQQVILLVRTT